jgi:hypothetical protein
VKELWATLVAPVIVGIIVGYSVGRDTLPQPVISVEISWIDAPNFLTSDHLGPESKDASDKQKVARTQLASLLDGYRRLDAASVKITNTSDRASKQIVASLPDGGVFFVQPDSKASSGIELTVPELNPGESTLALALIKPVSFADNPNILIMHDGVRIKPTYDRVPSELRWIVDFLRDNFVLAAMLFPVMIFAVLLMILAPFAVLIERSYDLKVRFTPKGELLKLKQFLDYVAEKYPEKLAE